MTKNELFLANILGSALFQADVDFSASPDINEISEEAVKQTVFILAFDVLNKKQFIPKSEVNKWTQTMSEFIILNEMVAFEQSVVLDLFQKNNIRCAVLKGASSAVNYPNPSLRISGDIDLLVDPENQNKAMELLQNHGYGKVFDKDHHCHLTVANDRTIVEIHKEPNGLFLNKNPVITQAFRDLFKNALDKIQIVNGIPMLSDIHQAVVLILHNLEHFLRGALGLRQLCDWAVFAHKKLTPELFSELKPILSNLGLLYFTEIMTKTCVNFLNLPPLEIFDNNISSNLTEEIMDYIFACGNMGVKNRKYGQHYFEDFYSKNSFFSFVKNIFKFSKKHFPLCKKYPILLPIAPFFSYAKYRKLKAMGKRENFNFFDLYFSSREKLKLYKKLKPFIVEKDALKNK